MHRRLATLLFLLCCPFWLSAADDFRLNEFKIFGDYALREQWPEAAFLVLGYAVLEAPQDTQTAELYIRAQLESKARHLGERSMRIVLLSAALNAHEEGMLYSTQILLSELQRLQPSDPHLQTLLDNTTRKIHAFEQAPQPSSLPPQPTPTPHPTTPTPPSPPKALPPALTTEITPTPPPANEQPIIKKAPKAEPQLPPIDPTPPATQPEATTTPLASRPTSRLQTSTISPPTPPPPLRPKHPEVLPDSSTPPAPIPATEQNLIQQWCLALPIDQITHDGAKTSIRIGDRLFFQGDMINLRHQVRWYGINAASHTLFFMDGKGRLYSRHY